MRELQRKSLEGPQQNGGWNGRPLPQRTKDSRNREETFLGTGRSLLIGAAPEGRAKTKGRLYNKPNRSPTFRRVAHHQIYQNTKWGYLQDKWGQLFSNRAGHPFLGSFKSLHTGCLERELTSAGEEPQVWPAEQSWMLFYLTQNLGLVHRVSDLLLVLKWFLVTN